jgi:hypothetical protein
MQQKAVTPFPAITDFKSSHPREQHCSEKFQFSGFKSQVGGTSRRSISSVLRVALRVMRDCSRKFRAEWRTDTIAGILSR